MYLFLNSHVQCTLLLSAVVVILQAAQSTFDSADVQMKLNAPGFRFYFPSYWAIAVGFIFLVLIDLSLDQPLHGFSSNIWPVTAVFCMWLCFSFVSYNLMLFLERRKVTGANQEGEDTISFSEARRKKRHSGNRIIGNGKSKFQERVHSLSRSRTLSLPSSSYYSASGKSPSQANCLLKEFSQLEILEALDKENVQAEEYCYGSFPYGLNFTVRVLQVAQFEENSEKMIHYISSLQHKNIASVLGYCVAISEAELIFKITKKKSLYDFFQSGLVSLSWNQRMKIALGICRAMDYLHNGCRQYFPICGISMKDIFLDEDFNPQILCYKIAHWENDDFAENHKKLDVFQVGALLFQLIFGKSLKESEIPQLLLQIKGKLKENKNNFTLLVDPKLKGEFNKIELQNIWQCGIWCTKTDSETRPKIEQVLSFVVSIQQRSTEVKRSEAPEWGFIKIRSHTTGLREKTNFLVPQRKIQSQPLSGIQLQHIQSENSSTNWDFPEPNEDLCYFESKNAHIVSPEPAKKIFTSLVEQAKQQTRIYDTYEGNSSSRSSSIGLLESTGNSTVNSKAQMSSDLRKSLTKLMQEERYEEAWSQLSSSGEKTKSDTETGPEITSSDIAREFQRKTRKQGKKSKVFGRLREHF